MFNVGFIVPRNSLKERTFAVVTATTPEKELRTQAPFLAAVQKAVTRWVEETPEGKEAWEKSSEDLNVGDLDFYMNDGNSHRQLKDFLADEGIGNMNIDLFSDSDVGPWSYDTVLARGIEENAQ